MIGLNETAITTEVAPFGGMKQSGLGREQSKCARKPVFETSGCFRSFWAWLWVLSLTEFELWFWLIQVCRGRL
jgi:hypothetical protein